MFSLLITIEAMILDISSAPLMKFSIKTLFISIVSLIRHSQHLVSFADLRAIILNFKKSFFEEPAIPSNRLAPIDVTLLISWSKSKK